MKNAVNEKVKGILYFNKVISTKYILVLKQQKIYNNIKINQGRESKRNDER